MCNPLRAETYITAYFYTCCTFCIYSCVSGVNRFECEDKSSAEIEQPVRIPDSYVPPSWHSVSSDWNECPEPLRVTRRYDKVDLTVCNNNQSASRCLSVVASAIYSTFSNCRVTFRSSRFKSPVPGSSLYKRDFYTVGRAKDKLQIRGPSNRMRRATAYRFIPVCLPSNLRCFIGYLKYLSFIRNLLSPIGARVY